MGGNVRWSTDGTTRRECFSSQGPTMRAQTVASSERAMGRLLALLAGGLFFALVILQGLAG